MSPIQFQLVVREKQKEQKNFINMGRTFVSTWEEHSSQLSLPQAYQLLHKVLDDIIASEQKPTTAMSHQSLKSPCLSKPVHRWPEVWEPRTSLYTQIPEDHQLCSKKSPMKKNISSQGCTKPVSLPPLQQSRQIRNATSSKWLPRSVSHINGIPEVAKEIPRKPVRLSNLTKIDAFPIVSL